MKEKQVFNVQGMEEESGQKIKRRTVAGCLRGVLVLQIQSFVTDQHFSFSADRENTSATGEGVKNGGVMGRQTTSNTRKQTGAFLPEDSGFILTWHALKTSHQIKCRHEILYT